jgi:hypothetical protein
MSTAACHHPSPSSTVVLIGKLAPQNVVSKSITHLENVELNKLKQSFALQDFSEPLIH